MEGKLNYKYLGFLEADTIKNKNEGGKRKDYLKKTRKLNRIGKVIHWEFCNRLIFYHTDKWYKNQNLLKEMRRIKFPRTLRYKRSSNPGQKSCRLVELTIE